MQTTSIVPSEDFAVISGLGEGGNKIKIKCVQKVCYCTVKTVWCQLSINMVLNVHRNHKAY